MIIFLEWIIFADLECEGEGPRTDLSQ